MKNKWMKALILILLLAAFFFPGALPSKESLPNNPGPVEIEETYTSKEDVAAYLHAYNSLPPNFIRKKEAQDLGWIASEGNLWEVAPGKSIGGDPFGNREGLLPKKDGRQWYECDIDYAGGKRGAKRLVFSSDGLIFYSEDHYKSFREIKFE